VVRDLRAVVPSLVVGVELIGIEAEVAVEPTADNGQVDRWVLCHFVYYRRALDGSFDLRWKSVDLDQAGTHGSWLTITGTGDGGGWRVTMQQQRGSAQGAHVWKLRTWTADEWLEVLTIMSLDDRPAIFLGSVTVEGAENLHASDVVATFRSHILGHLRPGTVEALFVHLDRRFGGLGVPPRGSAFRASMILMREDPPRT